MTPDEIRALAEVATDPAVVWSAVTGVDVRICAEFVRMVDAFVLESLPRIPVAAYSLVVDAATGSEAVKLPLIRKALTTEKPVVRVDSSFHFVGMTNEGLRMKDVQRRTRVEQTLEVLCQGSYVTYCVAGFVVREGDIARTTSHLPVASRFRRPMAEFDALLQDNLVASFQNERRVRYWFNRKKRILLASPDKTEVIFQRELKAWLEEHVLDQIRVYAESRGLGQDPTDITVMTASGDVVIEIKWLGENASGTKHGQPRIGDGIRQVAIYLDNDQKLTKGYVVCYDARTRDTHESESEWEATELHELCEPPRILFLESETASEKASAS
jgi:hypothetical protein